MGNDSHAVEITEPDVWGPRMPLDDRSRGFVHIDSFDHLLGWSEAQIDPLQRSNTPLLRRKGPDGPQNGKSQLMLIHDYEGSYLDYESCQGAALEQEKYSCEYLQHVEVFVYFSHKLVTVPPPTWTNTCHRNGVKVLGTFIVEPDTLQVEQILEQQDGEFWVGKRLASIAKAYGFDGWLINIERPIPALYWSSSAMEAFLRQLRSDMGPSRRLVWYDALIPLNVVWYQNTLNYLNIAFALAAGAILTNYAWNPAMAKQAREIAERSGLGTANVYFGIDAWAQNTYHGKYPRVTYPPKVGGGTGIGMGIKELASSGVNVGVFAPGWSFEHFQQHHREVERALWLGDEVVTDLPCDCTPAGLHLTVPYQEHPIVKFVAASPAGSSSFLHTDFGTAFGQRDEPDGSTKLYAHLGRQSVLPVPRKTDFRLETPINAGASGVRLFADLCNNPPRYSFSTRCHASTSGAEDMRISAKLRVFDLSVTDARPISLRLVYKKADTSGVILNIMVNDSDIIEFPGAPQSLTTITKLLPNSLRWPLQSIDLVINGALGRVQELGSSFLDFIGLTISPDLTLKPGVEIYNLRIEHRDNPHDARYRLIWKLSIHSESASDGMPFSDITGPFSHFLIHVNGKHVGVAFALEYEFMNDDLEVKESDRGIVVSITGVSFDGLLGASVQRSLLWPIVHEDDWVFV